VRRCHHFSRMAHPTYVKPCKDLGILEVSKPCTRFTPDARSLKINNDAAAINLAIAMATVPTSKLKVLAALINREARTRKRGYYFGEVVYMRVIGGDYISNYRKARILFAEKDYLHIEGSVDGFVASVMHSTVLNSKEWAKKKKQLLLEGKKRDPNYIRNFQTQTPQEKLFTKDLVNNDPPEITHKSKNSKVLVAVEMTTTKGKVKKLIRTKDVRTTPLDVLLSPKAIRVR
jgi:hypothetical protein